LSTVTVSPERMRSTRSLLATDLRERNQHHEL
jgi:hypothetical protein